ncbi:MAG: hypothetical protein IKF82_01540 [Bacilli bacterium]|nr:hypothetical protein [Bacilli bacterium]
MKNLYVYVFIILFFILGFYLFKHRKKPVQISELKNMHFSYSTSVMMNASVSYDLRYESSEYIATIKPNLVADNEAISVKISRDEVLMIEEVLKKYEVSKWDGFNQSDNNVLDGNSFSFSAELVSGERIGASGYMKYPKNYGEVKVKLDEIFMKFYKK